MILFRDTVMDKALPAKLLRYELDIAGYFAIFFVFALHQITQILRRFGPNIQPEKLQLCAYLWPFHGCIRFPVKDGDDLPRHFGRSDEAKSATG